MTPVVIYSAFVNIVSVVKDILIIVICIQILRKKKIS